MKKMKTILSILLAMLMTVSLCIAVFATSEDVVLSGTAGEGITWTLTNDGVLTVSGNGAIVDITETEYDEDGSYCTTLLASIGLSLSDYYDSLVEGLSAGEAARVRVSFVKEIVVEEGITEIPEEEFSAAYPRKVTLPASLNSLGYSAFDAKFAEEIVIGSASLPYAQFNVAAYETGAEPYADLEDAIEGYIATEQMREDYEYSQIPLEVLRTWADISFNGDASWWYEMSEEEQQELIDRYNAYLDTDETTLEALVPAALAMLNEHYGTDYASIDDLFTFVTDEEYGYSDIVLDTAIQEMLDEETARIYSDARLTGISLGTEADYVVAYDWLTVTAAAGGRIEEDCRISGVRFHALEGVIADDAENENLCKFCGKDHSGSLWQKFIGFLHKILYFFAHLFGQK